MESKKLALIRIWQILQKHSDYHHPLTQEDIIRYLDAEYGIQMERKAIGKNIADLRDAGIEIGSRRAGLACSALIDYDDYGYPEVVYLPSSLKTVFLNDWEYGEMEFHFGGTKNEWLALVNDEDSKTIQCWTSVVCSDGTLIYEE